MRNPEYAYSIAASINKLHKEFPEYTIGMHLVTALNGQELYTISDKDLSEALVDYVYELIINNEE